MDQSDIDTKSGLEALRPERFARNWEQGATRMLQAQERLAQGLLAAARLELRYGQELMSSSLRLMKWDGAEPRQPGGAAQEVEKFTTLLREITDELRNGFTEAAKLLTDGPVSFPEPQPASQVSHAPRRAARPPQSTAEGTEAHEP